MPNSLSLGGRPKFIYRVVLLLAAATLSACGGGGDGAPNVGSVDILRSSFLV